MLRGQRGQLLTDTRWVGVQGEVLVAYEENGCVTRGVSSDWVHHIIFTTYISF